MSGQLIIEHWRQLGVVYECSVSGKDDWLWMYASLHGNGRMVVTNDEMRDHWYDLLEERSFRRWKEFQIVQFAFERELAPTNWKIQLHMPKPFSHALQQADTGEWHLPAKESDDWLCIRASGDQGQPSGANPARWRGADSHWRGAAMLRLGEEGLKGHLPVARGMTQSVLRDLRGKWQRSGALPVATDGDMPSR